MASTKRQRLIGAIGEQRADMPRGAAVPDQGDGVEHQTRCESPDARANSDSNVLRSNPMALLSRAVSASRFAGR